MKKKKTKSMPKVKLDMPSAQPEQAPDFSEYEYVVTDLKRVAILATAMFALLIALSFFIH